MERYESLVPIIRKLRHQEPALRAAFKQFSNHLEAEYENDDSIEIELNDNCDELKINLPSCRIKAIYSYWEMKGTEFLQGKVSFYKQDFLDKNEYEYLYSFLFNHAGLTDIKSVDGKEIYFNYDVSSLRILLHVITLAITPV